MPIKTSTSERAILLSSLPVLLLALTAGLTIGLTFAPCHSSLCVETYFPPQTRFHIALYYGALAGATLLLYIRRQSPSLQFISEHHLFVQAVPLLGARVSIGGLVLCFWICGLTFASTAYWYPAQHKFWMLRGATVGWTKYMFRVAWTGVTGHWCDVWLGLVVMPVARNSVIAKVFRIQPSTLLQAHKIIAYGLLVFGLVHGLLYYFFIDAYDNAAANNDQIRHHFDTDNPFLTEEDHGPYARFVFPTGVIAGIGLIPMCITALPIIRRSNYNIFYFTHIIGAIAIMILLCLHASTNFYFLLPGLVLWVSDWMWRVSHRLGTQVEAIVEKAGNGWYRVRIMQNLETTSSVAMLEKGDKYDWESPVVSYFLNFADISKLQLHPFTAVSTGDAVSGPTFLFRRSPERKKREKSDGEWTWKLAALADSNGIRGGQVSRIEGPYSPPTLELFAANHVLLLAGGTGITGAISIAQWWASRSRDALAPSRTLHLIWTVRDGGIARVKEVDDVRILAERMSNMTVDIHVSGEAGRLLPDVEIDRFINSRQQDGERCWVYVSGPTGLLEDAETACVEQRKLLGRKEKGGSIDWYVASYST
ncbi:hypothetical protein K458DRAFT_461829 [Lentithecium fluviatile CBS 122367]|uniref:Ferric oxidoreductase domain-containing protein n=1 Tax=Lentithecium fluviatile CBS 122367 TaxID=1168545 RepID=A0A6G1IM59_9PLEO|nr:hypothetical protein K458DRAFT_461829 [Lentithecium fluviatile CBS 122367]